MTTKRSKIEKVIKSIEDTELGYLARERYLKSKPSDYIDIDKFEKKLKDKKGLSGNLQDKRRHY